MLGMIALLVTRHFPDKLDIETRVCRVIFMITKLRAPLLYIIPQVLVGLTTVGGQVKKGIQVFGIQRNRIFRLKQNVR